MHATRPNEPKRRRRVSLLAATAGLALLAGCEKSQPKTPAPAATAPPAPAPGGAPQPTPEIPTAGTRPAADVATRPAPADLALPPLATHAQSCARCHGPAGSFHADTLAQMDEPQLRAAVSRMMTTTAHLHPTAAELAAMLALHRATARAQPFACVTNAAAFSAGQDAAVHGECTPAATITARLAGGDKATAGRELPVRVDEGAFVIPDCPREPVTIRVQLGDAAVTFEFPAQQWPL